MPIHTKKAAVRNREVSINNQIASIFVNNNGTVSINQAAVPSYESKTATTSLAVSGTYHIPLVSSTSGNQVFNKSTNILYNTTTNTLNVQNLSTIYLPQCSVVPTESNQLVNKGYLDQYIGDPTKRWIYDDWLTGDISGSLNWEIYGSGSSVVSVQPSEPGHAGIVRIRRDQIQNAYATLRSNIKFTSNTIKCVRFLIRPFSLDGGINSVNLRINLGPYYTGTSEAMPTGANAAYWNFYAPGVFTNDSNINWSCGVNGINKSTYNAGTLGKKWVLFEIEINQQKPSFYITVIGETNRTLVYKELTETINSTALITPAIIFRHIGGTDGQAPIIDIDYVDILYNM
jgi:hypothetical protein